MPHIVIPTSATEQGHAFEDLILSHYHKSGRYTVREWSSYLHGASGKWWQCDGIVEDDQGRYLVEAKFFRDRPATVRDVNPARRQSAAQDMDCTGILYISLNGFAPDLHNWTHSASLDVQFLTWTDLRDDLLADLTNYASVLLDEFELTTVQAADAKSGASLRFDAITAISRSTQFPEFVTVPNGLERWLRRMPRFPLQLAQTSAGYFWYDTTTEQVTLVPDRVTDLSLQEAWAVQDTISGYASRTYNAVRATAQALATVDEGMIDDVQVVLRTMDWKTGRGGIRRALDFLVQLDMACKWLDGRRARYALLPLGRAYVAGGPDDELFADVLKEWLPYRAVCKAVVEHGVSARADGILNYFKAQYAPYEPYARSLFNPNKADGLTRLYKRFGC
jgi:hypothetical protein